MDSAPWLTLGLTIPLPSPSARVAVAFPVTVSTRPMASGCAAGPAWACWPGARGPASRAARSPATRAPASLNRSGGISVAK